MIRFVMVVVVALVLAPAFASNPGEPLDCSDWVFLEPGLSCVTVIPYPCISRRPASSCSRCLQMDWRREESSRRICH